MENRLKILLVEDDEVDAELLRRHLKKDFECDLEHVINKQGFILQLARFNPDIIISDNTLPTFNATEALKIVREQGLDTPFILVTGTVSEEFAVNIIKQGADDYILKDRIARLTTAIKSILAQRKLAREKDFIQQQIAESEEKYRTIFFKSPFPNWIYDVETLKFVDVNEAAINHYGYSAGEFMNMTILDIRPEEEIVKVKADLEKVSQDGGTRKGNWIHQKRNGELIIVETTAHDIIFNKRHTRLVIAVDVTEKVMAQEKLRKSEESYRTIMARVSDAFVAWDRNWNYTYVNKAAGEILGRDPESLIGKNVWVEFPDAMYNVLYDASNMALEQQQYCYVEEYFEILDRWLENHIYPSPDGLSIFFRDISARKKAEQELVENEMRLNQAQMIAHLGNWEVNFLTGKSKWSDEAYRIYGVEPGDHNFTFEEWLHFIHPDDVAEVRKTIDAARETVSDFALDHRIVRKNGEVRHVYSQTRHELDAQSRVVGIYGITHDITERKLADEELRRSNERFKYATLASSDIIWELNFETKQYIVHEGKEKLFTTHATMDWKMGIDGKYIIEEDREHVRESFAEARRDRNVEFWEREYRLLNAEEDIVYVINHAIFIRDENGKAIRAFGALTDITTRKQLESDLREQQRQEQLKIMATALEAQEKERTAIGVELHDNVNQILVGSNLILSMIKSMPEKTNELVEKAMMHIREAVEENRKIAHVFVAPDLSEKGLVDQLRRLFRNMLTTGGINYKLQSPRLQ